MTNYDFWLKKAFWTFYEAACLLNAIDPRLHKKQKDGEKFSAISNAHAQHQGYIGPNNLMKILKDANWNKYDQEPKNNKVLHESIIELAKDEGIKLPTKLLDALEKKQLYTRRGVV